jgi:hypothetical protein
MTIGKSIRVSRKNKELDGIKVYSADYFEMTYEKFGEPLSIVFMAPDEKKAKIKGKSVLHTHNGDKIIKIRKLNAKNLGPDISWNRDGTKHSRFQTRNRKLQVRVKKD